MTRFAAPTPPLNVPVVRSSVDAGGVQRVDQLVDPAALARLPRRTGSCPTACAASGRSSSVPVTIVSTVPVASSNANEPGACRALLVADDQVRRVLVVRPQRDLVVDCRTLRGHNARFQLLGERGELGRVGLSLGLGDLTADDDSASGLPTPNSFSECSASSLSRVDTEAEVELGDGGGGADRQDGGERDDRCRRESPRSRGGSDHSGTSRIDERGGVHASFSGFIRCSREQVSEPNGSAGLREGEQTETTSNQSMGSPRAMACNRAGSVGVNVAPPFSSGSLSSTSTSSSFVNWRSSQNVNFIGSARARRLPALGPADAVIAAETDGPLRHSDGRDHTVEISLWPTFMAM